MLEKKGIPESVTHSLKGCVVIDGVTYVSLQEILKFLRRFFNSEGYQLATVLQNSLKKEVNLPKAVILKSKLLQRLFGIKK